jgi:hypothetical protein
MDAASGASSSAPCRPSSAPPAPAPRRRRRTRRTDVRRSSGSSRGHQVRQDRAEAPTSMPATISALLFSAKPVAARQAGERVQQRDHDRHVGAADRQHEQLPEQRRAISITEKSSRTESGRRDDRRAGASARPRAASAALTICWPG